MSSYRCSNDWCKATFTEDFDECPNCGSGEFYNTCIELEPNDIKSALGFLEAFSAFNTRNDALSIASDIELERLITKWRDILRWSPAAKE